MKLFEKLAPYSPILASLVAAACIGTSLGSYTAPVYAETVAVQSEDTEDKEEKTEKEEVKTATVKQGSFDKADGVYEGTGTGFAGQIKVAVTIKDKTITAIEIVEVEADDDAFFNRAKGVIDKMIESQSLDVDVVSGATYSSNGIISAVKNALTGETDSGETGASSSGATAQGSASISAVEEPSAYKDGTYTGSGTGFGGTVTVQVVISGGKISSIQVLSHSDGSSYMNSASSVISSILSAQSTNVDTVSGATYSSVGIIEAVRNALSQAGTSGQTGTDTSTQPNENNNNQTDPTTPEKSGTIPYKDGIYFGVGEGFSGEMTVAVVIQDKTMKLVMVTESEDDEAFLNRAKVITETMVKKQTAEVDTVSGATFSSNGIIEAVKDALLNAEKATNGKTDETEPETDAESETSSESETDSESETNSEPETEPDLEKPIQYLWNIEVPCVPDENKDFDEYTLSMTVTVEDGRIVAIEDIKDKDGGTKSSNSSFIKRAANGTSKIKGVVEQILASGVPENIDTVSGATCTSKAIIDGCLLALEAEETN
jgi:uncharacterized protein with FMN-binding domain